jgi:hypothetical protein
LEATKSKYLVSVKQLNRRKELDKFAKFKINNLEIHKSDFNNQQKDEPNTNREDKSGPSQKILNAGIFIKKGGLN